MSTLEGRRSSGKSFERGDSIFVSRVDKPRIAMNYYNCQICLRITHISYIILQKDKLHSILVKLHFWSFMYYDCTILVL